MPSKSFSIVIKKPIKDFKKNIVVDSDKSISIRSFLIGSICQGISYVGNVLESEDVFSTINCLRKLNVKISYLGNKTYKIFGRGLGSYIAKKGISKIKTTPRVTSAAAAACFSRLWKAKLGTSW